MIDLVRKTVLRHRMITPGDKIVAGVSGGADSVALLHVLLALGEVFRLEVYAAHINHGLRGEASDGDELFVRELCGKLGVTLDVQRADVQKEAEARHLTIEEAGRQCRYAFFNTVLETRGADKIAVAHNMDDSAETVLLNLARGTGLRGLCGIPPVRGNIIRPLINQSRATIETFLSQNGVPYRHDMSNFQNGYVRNRVRNKILPLFIADVNENTVANAARSAALLRAEEDYMAEAARAAYESCRVHVGETGLARLNAAGKESIRLDAVNLEHLHPALLRRVIRMAYESVAKTVKDFSLIHADIATDIALGTVGREATLPAGVTVRKEYGGVLFCKDGAGRVEPVLYITLETDKPVPLPPFQKIVTVSLDKPANNACTKAFRCDRVSAGLVLRTWRSGDRITLSGVGTKKLQDYFTDRKVPKSLRGKIPLLADGNDILWIMDEAGRVNERYRPEENDKKFYVEVRDINV